jgi:hypothetical protein
MPHSSPAGNGATRLAHLKTAAERFLGALRIDAGVLQVVSETIRVRGKLLAVVRLKRRMGSGSAGVVGVLSILLRGCYSYAVGFLSRGESQAWSLPKIGSSLTSSAPGLSIRSKHPA